MNKNNMEEKNNLVEKLIAHDFDDKMSEFSMK